ncbi:MAG: hypothetical protein QF628_07315 [Acidimicrobiales bacterium]|nr:hypothetical protein [Acidimicrobiaceae bacterium]MDP7118070.1 hypothetical protein [Acidimicrobiales bacterium]MDP7411962.1 hypothetical protein [Acidimicrobiales bacterium]
MEAQVEHRLVDEEGKKRLMTVLYAGLWSLVLLTALVTVTHHLIEPQHGWISSLGVGGLVGFWVSILAAGVAGNGVYELRHERHAA